MKLLFIGIQGTHLKELIRRLPTEKVKFVREIFQANTTELARATAELNPDIDMVFFMGYVQIPGQEGSFGANVELATKLQQILGNDVVMVAATEHLTTDQELLKRGCVVVLMKENIPQWLATKLH